MLSYVPAKAFAVSHRGVDPFSCFLYGRGVHVIVIGLQGGTLSRITEKTDSIF